MVQPNRRHILLGATGAAALTVKPAYAGPDWDGYPRLMQGPRIGWTTPDSVSVWVRLSGEHSVALEYGLDPTLQGAMRSKSVKVSAETDYTAVLIAEGMKPKQEIYYRFLIDGQPTIVDKGKFTWKTQSAPQTDYAGRLRIAFGSCARYARSPVQPIWDGVARSEPDLFLWLGDNIYGDNLRPEGLREEYRRQFMVPNLTHVQSKVSQLAIWDDHDYALNDSDRRNPVRDKALAVFKDYWANPAYGSNEAAGVFFKHAYGPVDLFMLDNRYHRSPADEADGEKKTALGFKQREWLFDSLKSSQAVFKVIASGQGWTDAKGFGAESWSSFLHERNLILDFIRKEKIKGVILLSGDTHVAELNSIPDDDTGYDLIECVSSPLAQETAMSWLNYKPVPRLRQVYAGGVNFGLLEFDFSGDDPFVRINVRNVQGEPVWQPLDIYASQLAPGARIWRDNMDKVSSKRWKRFEETGAYYG